MTPPLPTGSLSEAALEARRAALRRGLARANTAAAVILLIVIGLALAAVWQAAKARRHTARADRSAAEAEAATWRAEDELRKAQFAQARAARASGLMGRRAESLAALRAAAAGRPSLELRNEAIAALALIDLREVWFQATNVVSPAPPAFDATFSHYAVSLSPGEVVVNRIADGALAATLRGPARWIFHLAFSPDGQFLAARFRTGRRLVWELASGAVVIDAKFAPEQRADTTAFSRDSQWFTACAPDGTLLFYQRAEPGSPWTKLNPLATHAQCFALDPKMDRLLLARGRSVEIRRRDDGALLTTQVFDQEVTKLAWHPDGRSCVAGQVNGLLMQWNADSTNAYAMSGHTAPLTHLEFNHRGDWLVSASEDGTTRLWAPGSRYASLVSRDGMALGFNQDDRQLAFVRPGEGFGVWEVSGGVEFRAVALSDSGQTATRTVDFAPDGRWLVAASPRHLTFWNVTASDLHSLIRVDGCSTAHFDAAGQAVVTTGSRGVELRSVKMVANGGGVSLGPPEPVFTRRPIRRVSVTRAGNEWLAVGGSPPMLLDLAATGKLHELAGVPRQEFVTLSPDGRWLAGSEGTKDGT